MYRQYLKLHSLLQVIQNLSASFSSSSGGSIVTPTPNVTLGKWALRMKLITCSYYVNFILILLVTLFLSILLDHPYIGSSIINLVLFIMIVISDLNNNKSALTTPVHSSKSIINY